MIGLEDLIRYGNTTQEVAGGDVPAQFAAWQVDHDGFFQYATAHANHMAQTYMCDPSAFVISFFTGFEMGYRAAVEVGAAVERAPDFIDFDPTDRRHD